MAKAAKKSKAKGKKKVKGKTKGKKQKLTSINGKTGDKTTYEKSDKGVHLVDHTPGSKWHDEAKERLHGIKAQIRMQCRTMGEGVYEIGLCLRLVRDDQLWKVDGAKSFNNWIEQHTDMSRATAYNMIAVAVHLSRDQAGKFGPTLSYSIAKATDEQAAKELRKLAQSGASATEVERARLQALKKRDQSEIEDPKKRSRGPRKVKRAVGVHNGNGSGGEVEVEMAEVKKSAAERRRANAGVERGETAIHDIKPLRVSKRDKKEGWDLAVPKMQIGENGPHVKLLINVKQMRVKYKIL